MDGRAAGIVNRLWKTASRPAWRRFTRAAQRVRHTQAALLKRYLDTNSDTLFGRQHGFGQIQSVEAFQRTLPLSTYDTYAPYIEQIGEGRPRVLTRDAVLLFEPSSGSTAASKQIPYTASLKKEFKRGVACWVYNLFSHYPHLMNGPAYWSVSPLTQGRRYSPGGVPIGFEKDTDYLGGTLSHILGTVMAVPGIVKDVDDMKAFRYVTLLHLLCCPEVRIFSVWHPTFLDLLLAALPAWWEALVQDVAMGTVTPPASLNPDLHQRLERGFYPAPLKAEELVRADPRDPATLWPNLGLISCWADGPSATYAGSLKNRFPQVPLQGKGLLATEAFVSFPLVGVPSPVLALTSHFFEFLPMSAGTLDVQEDNPRLACDIEPGGVYAVVVTTGGGLYRYQLHDLVEVTGRWYGVPCFRFLGRIDQTSDRFGEKLNEGFVSVVLDRLFRTYGLAPQFALLAPDDTGTAFRYTLYLELSTPMEKSKRRSLDHDLDGALRQNFHYDYCRRLGQIAPATISMVKPGACETYLDICQAQGQRLGDVKARVLEKTTGWSRYFTHVEAIADKGLGTDG